MKENHAPLPGDAPVAVPAVVHGRVVLVVGAQGHEPQPARSQRELGQFIEDKLGFPGRGVPLAMRGRVAQWKPARVSDFLVVAFKSGDDRLDAFPDAVVVGHQSVPINRPAGK